MAGSLFLACNSTTPSGDSEAAIEPTSVNRFAVKHMHFGSASLAAEPRNDLPESVLVTLNSIPGKFGGNPQSEHEFQRLISSSDELVVKWDSLISGGHLGNPATHSDSQPFQSVSPATVRLMRIGTFIDAPEEGAIFPDSGFETIGFYSPSEKVNVSAIYFDGPAELKGMRATCDGTPVKADLSIPKAGLYFIFNRFENNQIHYLLLRDSKDLVFSVFTYSQVHQDYLAGLRAHFICPDV